MRRTSLAFVSLLSVLVPVASAQTFTEDGDIIRAIYGNDTYFLGGDIDAVAASDDDLVAAGGNVRIAEHVQGDVLAAGGTVEIAAPVEGDVRVAGGEVRITGDVAGDVFVMGGRVTMSQDSSVSGSMTIFGGEVTLAGDIGGALEVHAGVVRLRSAVKSANIDADELRVSGVIDGDAVISARTLEFTEGGRVAGNLRYWTSGEAKEYDPVVDGTITFDETLAPEPTIENEGLAATIFAAFGLFSLFSAALTIGILMFLTKSMFKESAKRLKGKPGWSFVIGFLYFVLTPIIALFFLLTIIGIPIAITLILLYVISILFAKVITAMVFARWIEQRQKASWHPVIVFFLSLGIFLALKLVTIIPIIGWIACLVLTFMGFGSYVSWKTDLYKKIR